MAMQILSKQISNHIYQSNESNNNKSNVLYTSPTKNQSQSTASKTLMKSIWSRIQSCKPSSLKKYKKNIHETGTSIKKINKSQQQVSQQKKIVLNIQSTSNPGFYQYINWLKLNAQFYAYVDKKYAENLWKILRLVNYGEVLIPTGLIYQIFVDINTNQQIGGFIELINKFLLNNKSVDQFSSFRDAKNYIDINTIQKVYKCKQNNENQYKSRQIRSRCNSVSVFDRNFIEAKIRSDKKITKICEGLVDQAKNMYQKPKISKYKSEQFKSLVKPERICHHAQKYKWKNEQQIYIQQYSENVQNLFKAKHFDKSLFDANIQQIPGVSQHLCRRKFCEAQKLKAKRYAQKPQYNKKRIF